MENALAVATGAVGGALARHYAGRGRGPWGTAAINIGGSFVLGAVVAASSLSPRTKLLLGTGFCGSFTTFSTYSVEAVRMWEAREAAAAAGYMMVNNAGSLAAAAAGAWVCGRAPGRSRAAAAKALQAQRARAAAQKGDPSGPTKGA